MENSWGKVRKIFDAALERGPDERDVFVVEACGDDLELLAEVRSLLSSHSEANSFMETPAVERVADIIDTVPTKPVVGRTFAHYQIIRQIGEGGMGEVYLARDQKLDRNVAVKILNANFSKNESNLHRFLREAKTASALNHPNILIVHDVGTSGDDHYIVSEFIEGETLRQRLHGQRLSYADVLDIAVQTANALAAAHEANLVHRDIKPENIMIRPDGFAKVLDFGLAKLVEQKNKTFLGSENSTIEHSPTAKGMILGTVNYMSPEQARGKDVDARTDIFSLGVVIYELLTGRTPFVGETTSDTISAILNNEPEPLSAFRPDVPAELQRVVSKTLRKDRNERYHHIKDLVVDLKDIKRGLDFTKKAERASASQTVTDEATDRNEAATEQLRLQTTSSAEYIVSEIRQHRKGVLALLLVLLATTVGAGYWFFSNSTTADARQIKSIAVLPLANLSGDPSQDYFADGMTEALIGDLSKIAALKVISRTSVMRYKGSGKSVPEIARELNVDGVIEGSVQRSGERFRITTQLIHAATDSPLWSKSYERSVSDILKLQSEIAQAVAGEISIKLTPDLQRKFGSAKSIDPDATEAFLLGKQYFHKWTKESERQAVEQFQKAVSIEPDYADAWAGLADAWTVRAMVGDIPIPEAEKPTRDAATRALEIDPQNAAAHISMCFIYNNYDFDWKRSEESCKRGIELDPSNAKGHFAYAYMLARLERWDEMSRQMETAINLDPAEPWWPSVHGSFLIQARRFEQSEKQFQRAISVDPNWQAIYSGLRNLYVELGRFDEAIRLAEAHNHGGLSLGYVYARKGDRNKALELLNSTAERNLAERALVYAALDDFDNAFRVIHEALDSREGFMFGYGNFLALEKLKSDPRWAEVSRRINLPPIH